MHIGEHIYIPIGLSETGTVLVELGFSILEHFGTKKIVFIII